MKLIFIIIIIILIYYLFFNKCDCNENFVDLDTFKKMIFGEKLNTLKDNKIIKTDILPHKNQLKQLLSKKNNKLIESSNIITSTFTKLLDIFPKNSLLDKNGRLEITKNPLVCIPIKIDLTTNYNNIVNTSDIIYYDINKPEENRTLIFNIKYNLTKISWERSLLNWYNNPINLELRLSFLNPDNGKYIYIIFPLVFKKVKNIENFQDSYYNLDDTKFKTSFNPKTDTISSSMKSGVMYSILENKDVTFNDTKNKLDSKPMSNNLYNSNNNLRTDMNFGFLPDMLDNSQLEKNVILQNIQGESTNDINDLLSGIDLDKLDLSIFPNNLDLKYIKDYLNTINFNTITKPINNVKYTIKEASSLLYLDYLIVDKTVVPDYICCSSNTFSNQYIYSDLQELQTKIINQNKYYCSKSLDESITYITQPYPYNQDIGNKIYNSLTTTLELF